MNLWPVIVREMRVAARERNTYRVRLLAALVMVFFCGFSLWLVTLVHNQAIPPRDLFFVLLWITNIFVLIAGFSLTADSVSEEKRESTLGLLFLTNLKGFDIILGKTAVALMRGAMALMGTIPILALPLLMGGTEAGELIRSLASVSMSLVLSMAIGIFCSTVARKSWTAYGISAAWLLLLVAALPAGCNLLRHFRHGELASWLELGSPSFTLLTSFAAGWGMSLKRWWSSMGALGVFSLAALGFAGILLPGVWKDRPPRAGRMNLGEFRRRLRFGGAAFRRALRELLLRINPVFWLSRRERISSLGFLVFLAGVALAQFFFLQIRWPRMRPEDQYVIAFVAWMFTAGLAHAMILLRLPIVAAERFSEDRKSGALELLVSTPLSVREILRGHWLGLIRYFAGPIAIALSLHVIPICYLIVLQPVIARKSQGFWQLLWETGRHLILQDISNNWENHFALLVMLGLLPVLVLSWLSLAWFSTYLSLRMKRVLAIPAVALGILHLPPWFGVAGVASFMEFQRHRATNPFAFSNSFNEVLFYYAVAFVFETSSQLFWLWWSRRRLRRDFRLYAADRYGAPKSARRWWKPRLV